MTSLDTYIQDKTEEIDKLAPNFNVSLACIAAFKAILIESIRQTARETVEDLVPEEREPTNSNGRNIPLLPQEKIHNEIRTAILASAKEKGLIN